MANKEALSFDVVIVLAIAIAFLYPNLSPAIFPYIRYPIMTVMFLTFLLLDLKETFSVKVIGLWALSNLAILPFVAYLLSHLINQQEIKLGLILLSLTPTAIMSPVYASMVKGNKMQATSISVISNLSSILTIPLLLFIYTGKSIHINYSALIINIAYLILIPFILSVIFKRIAHVKQTLAEYNSAITKILLFILLYAIVGENSKLLISKNVIFVFMIVFLLTLASFFVGYMLSIFGKLKRSERNTLTICTGVRNTALMIGIISASFTPQVALPVAINVITHQIGNSIVIRLANKKII